jgi:hypothetical protein
MFISETPEKRPERHEVATDTCRQPVHPNDPQSIDPPEYVSKISATGRKEAQMTLSVRSEEDAVTHNNDA